MAKPIIESFNFETGTLISGRYEILGKLGSGWEGEVYFVLERGTQIERAAKFFFPHRNAGRRTSNFHARKLHKLRNLSVIIPYHVQGEISFEGQSVIYLVADYVDGELLSDFLERQPGKKLSIFQGLHLLHAITLGMEQIHAFNEYHGDLHAENIIVRKFGLGFDLKFLDFFHWGPKKRENKQDDIYDIIKIFYDAIGGKKNYSKHPEAVRYICAGLKKHLIRKRFPTISRLRQYVELLEWD